MAPYCVNFKYFNSDVYHQVVVLAVSSCHAIQVFFRGIDINLGIDINSIDHHTFEVFEIPHISDRLTKRYSLSGTIYDGLDV